MTGVIGSPLSIETASQAALEETRVRPQALDDLRLLLQDVQRRDTRGGDAWQVGGGEEKRPGAMVEEFDERPAAGDVTAEHADGLRKGPDLDIDATVHAEVIDGPAAVPAEHPLACASSTIMMQSNSSPSAHSSEAPGRRPC